LDKIGILTMDQVEDVEFCYPYYRFIEEGYDVDVLPPPGSTHPRRGVGPAAVRCDENALALVQAFAQTGNLIGAAGHGPLPR
jgi:protease I